MHQHLEPHQWAFVFGDPASARGRQLRTCPHCRPLKSTLPGWLRTVEQCADCTAALESTGPLHVEISSCKACKAAYEVFLGWLDDLEEPEPEIAPEWVTGADLYQELAHLPLQEQLAEVRSRPVYRQGGLCQHLNADSQAAQLSNPRRSHDRAVLAAAIADWLDEEEYSPRWIAELRAKSHAYRGNGLRLLGDFSGADRAFTRAGAWVDRADAHGRARATVLDLRSSLLLDLARPREAEALLERQHRECLRRGEVADAAQARVKLAMVKRAEGLCREALKWTDRALAILDRGQVLLLRAIVLHNRVQYLIECGDLRKARSAFDRLTKPDGGIFHLRRRWLSGDLLRAEGELDEAEKVFDEVRMSFLAEGLHRNVSLLTIELSELALQRKRYDRAYALARSVLGPLHRAGVAAEISKAHHLLEAARNHKTIRHDLH